MQKSVPSFDWESRASTAQSRLSRKRAQSSRKKEIGFEGMWLSLLFLFRVLCVLLRPSQKIEGCLTKVYRSEVKSGTQALTRRLNGKTSYSEWTLRRVKTSCQTGASWARFNSHQFVAFSAQACFQKGSSLQTDPHPSQVVLEGPWSNPGPYPDTHCSAISSIFDVGRRA